MLPWHRGWCRWRMEPIWAGQFSIPAACCGVFGLKPTAGLNPVGPYYQEISNGFNSDHVLTRTVRDSAAALDSSVGALLGNRYQVKPEVDSFLESLHQPVPKLKIGVSTSTPYGLETGGAQAASVKRVSEVLEDMGHEISEYHYPQDLGLGSWMESLWMVDVAQEIDKRIAETGREPEDHELEALTRFFLRARVAGLSAMDLYRARQDAHEVSIKMMNTMKHIDLVLTPALASDPIPVGAMDSRTENFDFHTWGETGHAFAPFSYICNVTGQPSASLPVQLNPGEHPCAVPVGRAHLPGSHHPSGCGTVRTAFSMAPPTGRRYGLEICNHFDFWGGAMSSAFGKYPRLLMGVSELHRRRHSWRGHTCGADNRWLRCRW